MVKKVLATLIAATLALSALAGCSSSAVSNDDSDGGYQKLSLAMAVNGTDTQVDTRVANKFAELVLEASGGNIVIDVFPNDQLAGGNATKGIEMISTGSVDLAAYATSVMSALDEQLLVGTIPWIFNNYTEARETIDATGLDYYASILESQDITVLGSFHNGFRQLTNSKRAVTTPEDLKGLKIRVPGGEVYLNFFRAFGADPVAMSWSEVFTAIQQGTIDGQENGVSVTSSSGMAEIQKYMTIWNYTYENNLFVANSLVWDSLEPETQELLKEKAVEACNWGRDLVEEEQETLLKEFEEAGMEVTVLTEEELEPFKEVVSDLREGFFEKYGEEACKAFGIE